MSYRPPFRPVGLFQPITPLDTRAKQKYDAASMKKMLAEGKAMKNDNGDPSFPIADSEDLHNAVQAIGRASNPAAAKAHIKKQAKALGLTDQLPTDWRSEDDDMTTREPYTVHPGEDVKCPTCGKMNMKDAKFCDQCGAKLPGTRSEWKDLSDRGSGHKFGGKPGGKCSDCGKGMKDEAHKESWPPSWRGEAEPTRVGDVPIFKSFRDIAPGGAARSDDELETRNWKKWHEEHPYVPHPRKKGESTQEYDKRLHADYKKWLNTDSADVMKHITLPGDKPYGSKERSAHADWVKGGAKGYSPTSTVLVHRRDEVMKNESLTGDLKNRLVTAHNNALHSSLGADLMARKGDHEGASKGYADAAHSLDKASSDIKEFYGQDAFGHKSLKAHGEGMAIGSDHAEAASQAESFHHTPITDEEFMANAGHQSGNPGTGHLSADGGVKNAFSSEDGSDAEVDIQKGWDDIQSGTSWEKSKDAPDAWRERPAAHFDPVLKGKAGWHYDKHLDEAKKAINEGNPEGANYHTMRALAFKNGTDLPGTEAKVHEPGVASSEDAKAMHYWDTISMAKPTTAMLDAHEHLAKPINEAIHSPLPSSTKIPVPGEHIGVPTRMFTKGSAPWGPASKIQLHVDPGAMGTDMEPYAQYKGEGGVVSGGTFKVSSVSKDAKGTTHIYAKQSVTNLTGRNLHEEGITGDSAVGKTAPSIASPSDLHGHAVKQVATPEDLDNAAKMFPLGTALAPANPYPFGTAQYHAYNMGHRVGQGIAGGSLGPELGNTYNGVPASEATKKAYREGHAKGKAERSGPAPKFRIMPSLHRRS